jgi:hypothetical protein
VTRALRHLLFAVALLFSQHAAMLHGLSHAQHDVALAKQGGKAPPLGHNLHVCAAFGALAQAVGGCAAAFSVETTAVAAGAPLARGRSAALRIVFDPRAPPSLA